MPHPTRPPAPRTLRPGELDRLVGHLLGLHTRPPRSPVAPALVRARPTPEGVDLALRPLPTGTHPTDLLLGHVVPARWAAAGVVAPATARTVGARGPGRHVTVAVLVGRDGTIAHRGCTVAGDGVPSDHETPTGRLVDLLRRALGLPTPPPQDPPLRLWEAVWLDAVVADAATGGSAGLTPDLADALARTTSARAHRDWADLRRLAAATAHPANATDAALATVLRDLIDPVAAAWMDDGSFSRWVLGALPAPEDLVEAVDALLPGARAEAVHRALVGGPSTGAAPAPGSPAARQTVHDRAAARQ